MKSLILFGGSFDPIHNGHLKIAENALKTLDAERVIFVPAKNPRWKEVTDVKHRLVMLNLAIKDYDSFSISNYEIEQDAPVSYSINTARYFREKYPNRTLYFLIGFDQLDQLSQWHEIDELAKLVKIVAFARKGYPKNHTSITNYNVQVIETFRIPVSSTKIRLLQSLDTPKEVIDYIVDNEMYFIKSIKAYMSENRFKHSVSVARLAYDIAKSNNLEPSIMYQAGLLHDIAKEIDIKEQEGWMKEFFPNFRTCPKVAWHQWIGQYIAQEYFSITDENILNSIMYHTSGHSNMTVYEKILYCADKIEPLRGFDSSNLIATCKKDISTGFIDVLIDNKKYFIAHDIKFLEIKLTEEMFKYYKLLEE